MVAPAWRYRERIVSPVNARSDVESLRIGIQRPVRSTTNIGMNSLACPSSSTYQEALRSVLCRG
jgi:hypothetical protein